ncbi:hypothetical protein LOD99_11135 [Oopsacas minuta]|uniref:Uncharacterized protein n=1 Tax=Oopsacas minuta TaxID=111878 RepID=A0AAV7KA71_9METZ|nr:hypothetical protein LOD99_11135 [Oopsacas minuta]
MPLLDKIFASSQSSPRVESQSQSPEQSDISEFMHTDMTEEPLSEHFSASAPVAEAEFCTDLKQQMCSRVLPWYRQLFDFMNQLYTYFSASTHRWLALNEALGPGRLVVQKLSTTRWSARVDAAVALDKGYDAILVALCEIANDVYQTANAR